jgi:imidazole glycerol-phosphate synthase subunit HisH
MKVVIIQYNAGNTQSVSFALQRLGIDPVISDDPDIIRTADKVIFPGVGEASTAMHYLRERNLDKVIPGLQQPVLGICLGMQLLCDFSEENDTTCLGLVPIQVKKFSSPSEKVPQVGWNTIYNLQEPLFTGIPEQSYIYNVHSYYAEHSPYTIATGNYVHEYAAAIRNNNFFGVQFHTEKSAVIGERILSNFLQL